MQSSFLRSSGHQPHSIWHTRELLPLPHRLFGQETEKVVVAPADGKIVVVEEVEENEYFHDRRIDGIYIHESGQCTRQLVSGRRYGKEGMAQKREVHESLAAQSQHRQRAFHRSNRNSGSVEIMARQIAGAMARRIVTYAEPGEECYIDEHMGFIKFGSRVDVFLPLGTEVFVKLGQLTTAIRP